MSEVQAETNTPTSTETEAKEPSLLEQLEHAHRNYSVAMSLIANGEYLGAKCREIFQCLSFFQEIKEGLAKQIAELKPKPAPEVENDAAADEALAN